jgi:hypothetical protein
MDEERLIAQIKGLELQLAVLEAQVRQLKASRTPKTFADLRGILKGKVQSTEEEIEAAKYHFEWEGKEER